MKNFLFSILINLIIFSFLPLLHHFFYKPPSEVKPIQIEIVKIEMKKIKPKDKPKPKNVREKTKRRKRMLKPEFKRRITFELDPSALSEEIDLIGVTYDLSEVDQPPRLAEYIEPDYPEDALTRGIEGVAILKILIDREGKVVMVKILSHGGFYKFGEAARRTVKRWRFEPARIMGTPVVVWCIQAVRFSLKKK